jgi:protein PhnA
MSVEKTILERSESKCELCGSDSDTKIYEVAPKENSTVDNTALICSLCINQIETPENTEPNHWHCLNDSMWSEIDAVKVLAWRMLTRLGKQDLLDMMYLEDDTLKWAKETGEGEDESEKIIHRDCNGVILQAGDSVVLIKDLKVKGSSMVAKQGNAVRRISLDPDNANYIEGKVEGQHIVIITEYVKKM